MAYMNSKNMKVKIPCRAQKCFVGDEKLQRGTKVYSLLEEENGEYLRSDYCESCWNEKKEKAPLSPNSIFWSVEVPSLEKMEENEQNEEKDMLTNLRELVDSEDEDDTFMSFFLSLYLERKRQIVRRESTEEFIYYEVISTEEMLAIKRVNPVSPLATQINDRLTALIARNTSTPFSGEHKTEEGKMAPHSSL